MMTIRLKSRLRQLLFLLAILVAGELSGQPQDFATWWEFTMGGGLKNGIDLSGEIGQRFNNNSLQFDRTLFTIAGDYNLKDYLNLAAGFRTIFVTDMESRVHDRYRIHLDATGHHVLSSTDLSLRIRFQYGFEDILYMGNFSQNIFISRQRLKLFHHFFGTRVGASASLENWIRFEDPCGRPFYKIRFEAAALYDLSFHSRFSFRYILENEFNVVRPVRTHILGLAYAYKF